MNTLFDKIWDAHVVTTVEDGPTQLYIDRLYCHEVTSPQAFAGLRERGIGVLRPEKVFCMPDHNTPTHDQDKEIEDPISKTQVDTLTKNAKDFGLTHYGMMHPKNGIIHVVGPERGLTLPGMTIVCGDSHTSTHGAMGAIAIITHRELTLVVVAGVFVIETFSVIIQTISVVFFHKKVFLMSPLHHHFEKLGWKEPDIVKTFWIAGLVLAMSGIIFGVWL